MEKRKMKGSDGISHWDEHQSDLDVQCDLSEMDVIQPKQVFITLGIGLIVLILANILHWSNTYVDATGVIQVKASLGGLLFLALVSGIFGYYAGMALKKVWLAVPVVLMMGVLTVLIGTYYGPSIIFGEYPSFNARLIIGLMVCPFIAVLASLPGVGRFYFA